MNMGFHKKKNSHLFQKICAKTSKKEKNSTLSSDTKAKKKTLTLSSRTMIL
jgi:hypothetical protein